MCLPACSTAPLLRTPSLALGMLWHRLKDVV